MNTWNKSLYFEKRDLWVGVYWDRKIIDVNDVACSHLALNIYICLLPTIVIHLQRLTPYSYPPLSENTNG